MTKIKATYLGDLHIEAVHLHSGSRIQTDAPVDNQGKGELFSPTDLFAASLAACMMTIMGISARSYGFALEGAYAEVEKIMASSPRRVGEIVIDLFFPDGKTYGEREKRLIETATKTCPVANSIHPEVKKTIRFHY
ncbi:MAG: OsmC family protein [Bacteroidales bacterium]|jgi:putative redox protein|nr:OsmC family protein [Bacteroidales bacterium]